MPKPPKPPAGHILLTRVPHSRTIKVEYPGGETSFYLHTPNIFLELEAAGVPKERMTKILDYVWNFYSVVVKATKDTP